MSAVYEYETGVQTEAFFESVATAARGGKRHGPLARTAMAAARAALIEGNKACAGDAECEGEFEWEASPSLFHQSFSLQEGVPATMMMEHLGHSAAEAESNGEAFALLAPQLPMALKALPLIGKGIGLAAKSLPKVASTFMKVAPKVMKGVEGAAKALRANPMTKPLVQALPNVVRQTTADIARQVGNGQQVSPQVAVRMFAKNTANVLGNPQRVMRAVNVSKRADQRVHRAFTLPAAAASPAIAQPTCTCQQ